MACEIPLTGKDEFYTVWCEWDIGQKGTLFQSIDDANKWTQENWPESELGSLPEAIDQGLVTVESLEAIRPNQMTTEKTEVSLVTVYGVIFFDHKGTSIIEWYLQYETANEYCDGDVSPIVVETFEGSNVHLKAVENGTD